MSTLNLRILLIAFALTGAGIFVASTRAEAAKVRTCFGEPARVIKPGKHLTLRRGQVAILINRRVSRVDAAGGNLICARGGPVALTLGAQGTSKVTLNRGDDRVRLVGKLKHRFDRTIWTGLGNDRVSVTGRGHTTTYLSPKKVKEGARDTDFYSGNMDIDTVYDYGGGTNSKPNIIKGNRALDYLHSAGTARSDIHGGDGTDYLYAASRGEGRDRLFGDRGNDRLNAKGGGKRSNGAYMDGAEGDDWYYGSAGPDTIISLSGVKKIYAGGGNDSIIRTAIGKSTIYGGQGRDTLSYMGQVPPGWRPRSSGVFIDLYGKGSARASNKGEDVRIASIEHLIGSAFDDYIRGPKGKYEVDGGPGDDVIMTKDGSWGDGGLGHDGCGGSYHFPDRWENCEGIGAGPPQEDIQLAVDDDGVMVLSGGPEDDVISVSYDSDHEGFQVETDSQVSVSGACQETEEDDYLCSVEPDKLSIAVVAGGDGNDTITLKSIPEHMNLIVDGGAGEDQVTGAISREVTFRVESGHLGRGNDQIWMTADSTLNAGPGSDTVHMTEMCVGGYVRGGPGVRDGIVFAGLKKGVWASMKGLKARYLEGPCAKPFRFADDWEGLEGTREDDVLIGTKRRGITFLGRDGIDTIKARNGKFDKITVGEGGKKNKVYADPIDRIHWDWGYAAF